MSKQRISHHKTRTRHLMSLQDTCIRWRRSINRFHKDQYCLSVTHVSTIQLGLPPLADEWRQPSLVGGLSFRGPDSRHNLNLRLRSVDPLIEEGTGRDQHWQWIGGDEEKNILTLTPFKSCQKNSWIGFPRFLNYQKRQSSHSNLNLPSQAPTAPSQNHVYSYRWLLSITYRLLSSVISWLSSILK
jgi:hypothetical protein